MLKKKNLWRGLTMVFALLLAVSMMAGNILELYRTSVDAFLGTRSTQTVTEQSDDESDAWTYKSEFTTAKEAYEGFKDFAIEASQETFALLKNENGALPLAKDAKITMLGVRSYAPVYGNSGGKDSALVGILCKAACDNTVGIMMPCASKRNFGEDMSDGLAVAEQFNIETRTVDLTAEKELVMQTLSAVTTLNQMATSNIAPRLRMLTLYTIGAAEGRLVAGTGNRSEAYMGYFTKWGDGAYDFNPIADLTVTEVYEFLTWLHAPENIIRKAPSAGLFEGQTDEQEMGVTYAAIDRYILTGEANEHDKAIIDRYHSRSEHKRRPAATYHAE